VISGKLRGLKLATLDSDVARPTTDRVKENLFNIIAPFLEGAYVLDLFSGTGSLAIEALSRGSERAILVDRDRDCIKIIERNISSSHFEEITKVMNLDYIEALNKLSDGNNKFDIIFLDPPYSKGLIDASLKLIDNLKLVVEDGLIVAEKHIEDIVPDKVGFIKLVRKQKYGKTELCFYRYLISDKETID